jgi:hypothetical protein
MGPKREFEPSANDHDADSSRQVTPAAFAIALLLPLRDRIYVTVAIARSYGRRKTVADQLWWKLTSVIE